jgi:MYXO-CTERM domain-containing protein
MRSTYKGRVAASAWLAFALFGASSEAATFVVENADDTDQGFKDKTHVPSIGGNPETTRGAQALAAFQLAADLWGEAIDSPVTIRVSARFGRLACTATAGVISSSTPRSFVHDTPGTKPGVLYPIALANRLAGKDLDPDAPDIDLAINGDVGTADCQRDKGFYLGLDRNSGELTDLVTTVMHEIGHGLGMTTLVDLKTGAWQSPSGADAGANGAMPDVFSTFLLDERTGKYWPDMTDAERADSARAFHQLSWGGPEVTGAAKGLLTKGMPALSFSGSLASLAPAIALAAFGPALTATMTPITGPLSAVDDGTGSPQDACETPARLDGKIAFIEAGGCTGLQKVLSVQGAGAIAAILVGDTASHVPLAPTGTGDTMTVAIPSLGITQQDAEKIRVSLGAAPVATLKIDDQRGVGTSVVGRIYLDATDPVVIGTSVAHWDPTVAPHLLMHPTLETSHSLDLTVPLMHDLGWHPFRCGDGVAEGTEECDEGENPSSGICSADCKLTGEGGAPIGDGGVSPGDAGTVVVPPRRYVDAGDVPANFDGIVWAPKHSSCSCRIGAGPADAQPLGVAGAALALGAFLRRRRAKRTTR